MSTSKSSRRRRTSVIIWMIISIFTRQVRGFVSTATRKVAGAFQHESSSLHLRVKTTPFLLFPRLVSTITTRQLSASTTDLSEEQKADLEAKIKTTGDKIRTLKEEGADKATVAPLVEELLSLKAKLDPSILKPKPKKQNQQKKPQKQQKQPKKGKNSQDSDDESDFITARSVDYSKWYNDLIRVTGLAETSPVRGCMVIKPWGMSLWDRVRNELDAKIQEHGAENAYFPLLIPKSFLSKEAEHVDGFAKECAVVTHHRLTAGEGGLIADPEAELEDPLIIR